MVRFFKCSSFYPSYLRHFYHSRRNVVDMPFAEQYDALMSDRFAWSDAWKYYLEQTGRFVVEDVVINAEPLQKAWAREHGVRYAEERWMLDILEAQIAEFRPDVWFCHTWDVPPSARTAIRKANPSIYCVMAYDGIARNDEEFFEGCDLLLSCVDFVCDHYSRHGFMSHFFKSGFDTRVLWHSGSVEKTVPVSFTGSVALFKKGHFGRLRWLDEVTRKLPVQVYVSHLPTTGAVARLLASPVYHGHWDLLADRLRGLPALRHIAKVNRGELYGLGMFRRLAESRISLNAHIDAAGSAAGNMRLFEATGVGSCLVTDWKENLIDFFVPDSEVVTFRTSDECVEKVRYLLDNDDECVEIAKRGQERVLRDHRLDSSIMKVADLLLGV